MVKMLRVVNTIFGSMTSTIYVKERKVKKYLKRGYKLERDFRPILIEER